MVTALEKHISYTGMALFTFVFVAGFYIFVRRYPVTNSILKPYTGSRYSDQTDLCCFFVSIMDWQIHWILYLIFCELNYPMIPILLMISWFHCKMLHVWPHLKDNNCPQQFGWYISKPNIINPMIEKGLAGTKC